MGMLRQLTAGFTSSDLVIGAIGVGSGPDPLPSLTTILLANGDTLYVVGAARSSTTRVMGGFALRSPTRTPFKFPRLIRIFCNPAAGRASGRSTTIHQFRGNNGSELSTSAKSLDDLLETEELCLLGAPHASPSIRSAQPATLIQLSM